MPTPSLRRQALPSRSAAQSSIAARATEAATETATRAAIHAADVAACRAVLKLNSRTFHAASLLLPRRIREPASVLYGFCRLADDAVDVDGGRLEAVARLEERVQRACAGTPLPVPADRALAEVVRRHAIPQALLDALIEGLRWDAEGRRYEDLQALQAYAARVAGTVGAMMATLMGARSPQALARACELGVAMQLSNIARDVGEDARMGRIYLPLQWLREAGVEPEAWLARPVFDERIGAVVQRLLREADLLYRRVGAGVAALPLDCRPGINAARYLYAEIGREVERAGLDSVSRRAVVPRRRKAGLLLQAMLALRPGRAGWSAPGLPATQFLVDAANLTAATVPVPRAERAEPVDRSAPAWWHFGSRWGAVLALFERIGQREQGADGRHR